MDKETQRNMLLAGILSVLVFVVFQILFPPPPPPVRPANPAGATGTVQPGMPATLPGVAAPGGAVALPRTQVLEGSPRLPIRTSRVDGSVALKGGRIDDLRLADYRTEPGGAEEVTLLNPQGAAEASFAELGWVAPPAAGLALPGPETLWSAPEGAVLTPETPVTLTWDNGAGLVFTRELAIDGDYLFTVTDRVRNQSGAAVTLSPYALIARHGTPQIAGLFILHEGPVGILDEEGLSLHDYDDLIEPGAEAPRGRTTDGWLGLTDKYWLTAVIPPKGVTVETRFAGIPGVLPIYQADYRAPALTVPPGETGSHAARVFAGAKEVRLLQRYETAQGIRRLDDAIDWGWFYFLTRPFFSVLEFFAQVLGHFGLAILATTVLVKLVMLPLANKSYVAMNRMKMLQPEVERLRARHQGDMQAMQTAMMALYKREKVNPASGCLPILVQIPVFFSLYKVLFISIEMRHTPFFGWIRDLSAPDPTSWLNLFGLIPWDPHAYLPPLLNLGAWPVILGATMILQAALNPKPPDPTQARVMQIMPVVFTFLFATFPAGLVIYYAWNNILSIAQQYLIKYRMERREEARKAAKALAASLAARREVAAEGPAAEAAAESGGPALATAAGPSLAPAGPTRITPGTAKRKKKR